jgi:hypothetical protein
MYHHRIMRTTLDIDDPVLRDLKRLQKREKKSLGRLVSDLLAEALGRRGSDEAGGNRFKWISKPMGARVDLADHDALLDAMDQPLPTSIREPRRR